MAPATTSSRAVSPARCPSLRGSPRSLAQRPLPSMTMATCWGMNFLGMGGGVVPVGCGGGLMGIGVFQVGCGFLGLLYRVGLWCFGFEVGEGFEGGFEVVLGGVEDEVEDFLGGVGGGFVDGVPVAGGEGVEVGGFLGVEWG